MNTFFAVFSCLLAASHASVIPLAAAPLAAPLAGEILVRAPAHDSASFSHHRLGGNFAYAVGTAEAFAKIVPKIAHQTIPVAEHTHIHTPAAIRTIQPAPIITKTFAATPVLAQQAVFGTEPVIGPVATEVTYKQPIYKTRTFTQTAHVAHTVAAPAVAVAPAAFAAAPAIAAAPALGYGLGGYGLGGYGLGLGYGAGIGALPALAGAPAVAAALPIAH